MATSTRLPSHHESPRTGMLRRPASLSGNTLPQKPFVRKHNRGHSLGFVGSPAAYMQHNPYGPPYHQTQRDHRLAMGGQAFPMTTHRGYGKPSRQQTISLRHAEKSKSKEKQKSKSDKDKGNVEHSFITSSVEIAEMQNDLLQLQEDFNTGKLQAFDEQCSFEKMDNIRDLQEKLARLHFRMDEKLQAEGLHPTETIEVANENMDHLLSNLDQLRIAIGSLHPPAEYDPRL